MKYLDLTLPDPEANLALDETLLAECEQNPVHEVLRIWEPQTYFVVLGASNQPELETFMEACTQDKIPVLRRVSGGGTVLLGPGCLCFTLILRIPVTGPLSQIKTSNQSILEKIRSALPFPVQIQGCTDLSLNDKKFCGSAQRRLRHSLLFHGSFLLTMDIRKIERYLRPPSRQPAYRQGRTHHDFLMSFPLESLELKKMLQSVWGAKVKD